MILMRDRRTEEREDTVTGRLGDVTAVALYRLHHYFEGWIDYGTGLLWIEVFDQVHRTLYVGEQRGDGLALALETFRRRRIRYPNLGAGVPWCGRRRCS